MGNDAEKRAVDALLASSMFQRAPNLRKLVAFLWEQYSLGNTAQIKEYTIGTEVLGRPPSFDQKRDAIVRVEMHRLRKRLREFYEGPGATSEVVMSIPEGSYVPVFERRTGLALSTPEEVRPWPEPAVEAAEEIYPEVWTEPGENLPAPITLPAPPPRRKRSSWWVGAGVLAMCVVLIALVLGAFISRKSSAAGATGPAAAPPPNVGSAAWPGIRILAGQENTDPRLDHLGQVWLSDRYFTGGVGRTGQHARISGTPEQFLFDGRREGDFQYKIPLDPGYYELRLYFAETVYGEGNVAGLGEAARLFSMGLNGAPALALFDVLADGWGPNAATIKVFKNVTPAADGHLHLSFSSYQNGRPLLNAIEIRPSQKGRILPIRMVAQDEAVRDSQGRVWLPDQWVTGGVRIRRPSGPVEPPERELYVGERYGNFTYRIPVAPGTYQLTVYLSEAWFGPGAEGGGGAGSRVFSLFCNHRPLLESFDLFTAAGGTGKPYKKTFTGLKPNAQGKLVLEFQPDVNYAMVNALSVDDISPVE